MSGIIANGITLTKINSICYVAPGTGKAVHTNRPYHGLVFYKAGMCGFRFDSTYIAASGGSVVYLPKGSNYFVEKVSETQGCYAINFDCLEAVSDIPFCITLKNKSRAESLFQTSEKLWKSKTPEDVSKCFGAFYEILSILQHEHSLKYLPDAKKQKINTALNHIHLHFTDEVLSVEDLALMCGMSSAYFRRLFSEIYGMSPVKYINNLKIERAKELISSDMYSVEEIAFLSGFSDSTYFRRVFRDITESTPTKYRKIIKL